MDYHDRFFKGISVPLEWTGWIRRACQDAGVVPENIPAKEREKFITAMSKLIVYLVNCTDKKARQEEKIKYLVEELRCRRS